MVFLLEIGIRNSICGNKTPAGINNTHRNGSHSNYANEDNKKTMIAEMHTRSRLSTNRLGTYKMPGISNGAPSSCDTTWSIFEPLQRVVMVLIGWSCTHAETKSVNH